ncbi:hypothetical protein CICLE_v10024524mg [Citrus x clementina]|uniref:Uncharacterized protein n=1 Tax=Citrus clementina TaxID=85681 RepID=V4VXX9_CITCL|nr:hypothetical protein CICLE_v10024524mg [Citrus x clementina]
MYRFNMYSSGYLANGKSFLLISVQLCLQRPMCQKFKSLMWIWEAKECIITIDSDEDINGGFSCLINEKETGNKNKLIHDEKEATERILRKARRRKRKYDNAIIIN